MDTSNTESQPTGFDDDNKSSVEVPAQKKKKGGKAVFAIVGVIFLALAGYAAYTMFLAPAPAPVSAPVKKKPKAAEVKPEVSPETAATVAAPVAGEVDPITGLPVNQPAPAVDPATGLPVGQAAPAVDPATGLPVGQAAPAVDPATGLPVATPVDAAQAQPETLPVSTSIQPAQAAPAAPADLMAATPAAPATVEAQAAPVVAQAAQAPVSDDVFAQFRDILAPIDGRVTKLEQDMGSLKSAVEKIQAELGLGSKKHSKPVKKKVVMKKKVAQKPKDSSSSKQEISSSSTVRPPVSTFIVDPATGKVVSSSGQSEAAPQAAPQAEQASQSSCSIEAIIPGRAWVKSSSNDLTSFGEGEKWFDGRVVEQIDPSQGVKVGGSWVCN